MWLFRNRNNKETKKIFEFFKFDNTGPGSLLAGKFIDKDFSYWLKFVHCQIQGILKSKYFNGNTIENYVQFTLYIGGQRVEVALIKDGCKSPHELLQEIKNNKHTGEV
jgi:hypothetical protein